MIDCAVHFLFPDAYYSKVWKAAAPPGDGDDGGDGALSSSSAATAVVREWADRATDSGVRPVHLLNQFDPFTRLF
jgi:hypothetical protein